MSCVLKMLHLKNFKCFKDHKVNFSDRTVMVGQNNAGKTTVIEALRILGLATARLSTTTVYSERPIWLSEVLPLAARGIHISVRAIDMDLERVFYRYGNPPAIIEAFFSNSILIRIFINSESELFVAFMHKNTFIMSKSKVSHSRKSRHERARENGMKWTESQYFIS